MAGIKDVAKKAGVGVGTVSRAINNSGYVSEKTRQRVEQAMAELDYTPNELARNLYRKKTGIVAVLVPTVSHPFFAEFVNYIEIELHERGYKTMICNTAKEKNYESEYLQMLKRHVVDGVITGVHSLNLQEYLDVEMPIVALDRYIGERIPVVAVNHKKGGRLAADEFIKAGCKYVLQFREAKQVESPAQERYIEFERIIRENHIKLYSYELEWNKFDLDYFGKVTKRAFREHPDADGAFGTDLLALSYLKVALSHGKKVPEDIKVVAYDGTQITKIADPGTVVIKQPIEMLAKEAVRLIVNRIDGKEYANRVVKLEVELIKDTLS